MDKNKYVWHYNIKTQERINSIYGLNNDSVVYQDKIGKFYIVSSQHVILMETKVQLHCFDTANFFD